MNAIPTVTKNLLIINVLVFLATIVAQSYGIDIDRYLGLHFSLLIISMWHNLSHTCLCMVDSRIYF